MSTPASEPTPKPAAATPPPAENAPSPAAVPRPRRSWPARIFAFLASFGVGVVVLSFLLLLTWLGTIEQVDHSLYDVQKKYFDSVFLWHDLGPLKVPLPGAFLLMGILFVNMLCGGIIRIRKNRRNVGVVLAHFSILFLLAAGGVSFFFKREGYLQLYEEESGAVFTSHHHRVLEITEVGADSPVLVIPEGRLEDCVNGRTRAFFHASLPFELTVTNYVRNAVAESDAMRPAPANLTVVDNYYLVPHPLEKEAEANLAGAYVTLKDADGTTKPILLWEPAVVPVTHRTADGRAFTLRLTRQTWELPFTVTLDKFTHEYFPGTMKNKVFASDITYRRFGVDHKFKIEMNKPLRSDGYTLYQTAWGPTNWDPRSGDKRYSVFTVANNPADKWPIYATIMAAVGIALHFVMKLGKFVTREQKRAKNA